MDDEPTVGARQRIGRCWSCSRAFDLGHDDAGLLRRWLHGVSAEAAEPSRAGVIWLLSVIVMVTIVIAGRAHSERPNEQDELSRSGISQQIFATRLTAAGVLVVWLVFAPGRTSIAVFIIVQGMQSTPGPLSNDESAVVTDSEIEFTMRRLPAGGERLHWFFIDL
jgi:hypothetical protein